MLGTLFQLSFTEICGLETIRIVRMAQVNSENVSPKILPFESIGCCQYADDNDVILIYLKNFFFSFKTLTNFHYFCQKSIKIDSP